MNYDRSDILRYLLQNELHSCPHHPAHDNADKLAESAFLTMLYAQIYANHGRYCKNRQPPVHAVFYTLFQTIYGIDSIVPVACASGGSNVPHHGTYHMLYL